MLNINFTYSVPTALVTYYEDSNDMAHEYVSGTLSDIAQYVANVVRVLEYANADVVDATTGELLITIES